MNEPSDQYEFEAIGTHWWLERLDGGRFNDSIREAFATYTTEFDRRYSRFRDDSLIIQLALRGVLRHPPTEMTTMLKYAEELYKASDGVFNPCVGAVLHTLGYGSRSHAGQSGPFNKLVSLSAAEIRVPKGLVLDFGGFGKGWLIDEYARILREHGVKEYIVNGGGDLYVEAAKPISFALEHPYDPALKIGDIQITKGALAASSTVKRAWRDGNKVYHHIIDPRTGMSSETDIVATFVQADSALIADSLATILIIRPDLKESLDKRYNAKTLLINAAV